MKFGVFINKIVINDNFIYKNNDDNLKYFSDHIIVMDHYSVRSEKYIYRVKMCLNCLNSNVFSSIFYVEICRALRLKGKHVNQFRSC